MDKLMIRLDELEWQPGPYPRSRMKVYPPVKDTSFFGVLIEIEPGGVLEEHEEPFNEITVVLSGEALIEGKRCPPGTYFFTPAGSRHGPFTSDEGCQVLVIKFNP